MSWFEVVCTVVQTNSHTTVVHEGDRRKGCVTDSVAHIAELHVRA